LEGVPEGLVTLEFYKPGYVVYSLKWLAYPLDDFDDIKESPNNISYSFTEGGSSDIQLQREIEQIMIDEYQNGTLTLSFVKDGSGALNISELFISNGKDDLSAVSIDHADPSIEVIGDGSFKVGLNEEGPFLTGFHPVGYEIDITAEIIELAGSLDDVVWSGNSSNLQITVMNEEPYGKLQFRLIDNITGDLVGTYPYHDQSGIGFGIAPGIYDVEITGRELRDRFLRSIILNESEQRYLTVTLEEGDVDEDLDLSIKGNYIVAVAYLGIALVMFFGAIYLRRGGSWAVLLILAFVGFLSRGLIDLYIININQLLAIALIVVLFSIRSEHNRKRQRLLDRRYNKRT
jgi:hypothetical protein